jgi:hypothetical protein
LFRFLFAAADFWFLASPSQNPAGPLLGSPSPCRSTNHAARTSFSLTPGARFFCRFESSAQIHVLRFSRPDSPNCSLKQDSALRPGLHCSSVFFVLFPGAVPLSISFATLCSPVPATARFSPFMLVLCGRKTGPRC